MVAVGIDAATAAPVCAASCLRRTAVAAGPVRGAYELSLQRARWPHGPGEWFLI
eukprot:SAG22_NODE_529_length_9428_cov_2.691178_2_plen_54_part_00